ncbi:uncharacterized protein [Palaemon carinicauda]|uniref:uncharacterized protein n=1 Tax=Palaemon carinicauda TaxID=392227 RepID=UPI0035B5BA6C
MAKIWPCAILFVSILGFTTATEAMNITSVSMYWEDHIIVCTNLSSKHNETFPDNVYNLITKLRNYTVENTTAALLDTTGNETCIISQEKYQLKGFHTLSVTVLSKSSSDGIIQAEGNTNWSYIFPLQQPTIRVIATTSFIFTTWNIVDNSNLEYDYNLTLHATEMSKTITLQSEGGDHATYTFQKPALGRHSVCVQAFVRVNPIYTSNTYCSNIIDIMNYGVMSIPSPVKDLKAMATSTSSIFVKWRHPDEDNEESDLMYVVSWSMEAFFLTEDQLDKQNPFALGGFYCDSKFVGHALSSTEIRGLETGGNYTVCVTAITNNIARGSSCNSVDLDDFHYVSPPQDLRYNPAAKDKHGLLKDDTASISWKDLENNVSFWVKWHREIDGKSAHVETADSEINIQLPPGLWNISVRAMQGHSASEKTYTNASVTGLIIYTQQVSSHSVAVSWDEWPLPLGPIHYNATLKYKKKILQLSTPLYCSGNHTDCQYQFNNLNVGLPVMLEVLVQNEDEAYVQASDTIIEAIGDVSYLKQDETNEKEVAVVWPEVDNANIYLLSVYPDQNLTVLRYRTIVTLPTRLTLPLKSLDGNVVQLQPCKSINRCGNIINATLSVGPPPPKNSALPVIGVSTALLILTFAIICAIVGKKVHHHYYGDHMDELEAEPLILVNDAWRNYPRYVPDHEAGPSHGYHGKGKGKDKKKGKGKNKSSKNTREVLIKDETD